jgi:hypothetical protein
MDDETIGMILTIIMLGCLLVLVGLGVIITILYPVAVLAFIGLMVVLWFLAEYVFKDILGDLIAAALMPSICGMVMVAAPDEEDNNDQ